MTTRRLRRSKRSGSKRSGSKRSGTKRSGSKRRGSSRRTRRYIKGAGFGSLFKSNRVGQEPPSSKPYVDPYLAIQTKRLASKQVEAEAREEAAAEKRIITKRALSHINN